MTKHYEPLEIQITEQAEHNYPVTARFRGGSWAGAIPADLPLISPAEIQRAHEWMERGFLDREYARDFGSRLFQTLFSGAILQGLRECVQQASAERTGVRLVLTLPRSLADIPWELMYDASGGLGFLARSETTSLARHATGIPIPHQPPAQEKLRVLVIAASPKGLPPVRAGEEIASLKEALEQSGRKLNSWWKRWRMLRSLGRLGRSWKGFGEIDIQVIENTTRPALQEYLAQARQTGKPYHVIHFIGHGVLNAQGHHLALEGPGGSPDLVPAEEFAEMTAIPGVCLVVLNACQTAAGLGLFDSLAHEFLKRRVPAVIGMQVQVLDQAALDFAQYFYQFWAAGEPLEAALTYARRLISASAPGSAADWGIPVLFMGPVEGISLNLPPPQLLRAPRKVGNVIWLILGTIIPTFLFYQGVVRQLLPAPVPMQRGFNIAICQFGEVSREGEKLRRTSDSKLLTGFVADSLEALETDPALDNLIEVTAQPVMIQGATPAEREAAAQKLAEQVNAHIVIYGVMDLTDYQFHPEIYVSEQFADIQDLGNPSEMSGSLISSQGEMAGAIAFSSPIPFRKPFSTTKNATAITQNLEPRLKALSYFMAGLAYYYGDWFDRAVASISTAIEEYQPSGPQTLSRSEQPGLGVLQYFLGVAWMRLAYTEQDEAAKMEALSRAGEAYQAALDATDGKYIRAHLGFGSLALAMATYFPEYDLDLLDEAILHYRQVLELSDTLDNSSSYLSAKAYFNIGLAQVYQAQYSLSENCPNSEVIHNLGQAFQAYEREPGMPWFQEIGAKSAYQLGLVYAACADLQQAEGSRAEAAENYSLAEAQFRQSMVLSEPPLVRKPGWLGLPIGAPPPEIHEQQWHRVRWEARNQLAYLYLTQATPGDTGWYDQAIVVLLEVTSTYEHNPASMAPGTAALAYFNLGIACQETGKVDQAVAAFTQTIQLSATDSNMAEQAEAYLAALGK